MTAPGRVQETCRLAGAGRMDGLKRPGRVRSLQSVHRRWIEEWPASCGRPPTMTWGQTEPSRPGSLGRPVQRNIHYNGKSHRLSIPNFPQSPGPLCLYWHHLIRAASLATVPGSQLMFPNSVVSSNRRKIREFPYKSSLPRRSRWRGCGPNSRTVGQNRTPSRALPSNTHPSQWALRVSREAERV